MKTLTCSQMGGPCDAKISGATSDELLANAMKHLEEAHPERATEVHATPETDPKMVEWNVKFQKDFADAPEEMEIPAAAEAEAATAPEAPAEAESAPQA